MPWVSFLYTGTLTLSGIIMPIHTHEPTSTDYCVTCPVQLLK